MCGIICSCGFNLFVKLNVMFQCWALVQWKLLSTKSTRRRFESRNDRFRKNKIKKNWELGCLRITSPKLCKSGSFGHWVQSLRSILSEYDDSDVQKIAKA